MHLTYINIFIEYSVAENKFGEKIETPGELMKSVSIKANTKPHQAQQV